MRLRQLVKLHLNRQFQQREAHHLFYLNRLLNFYHIFELSVAVFVYVVVCVVVCAVVFVCVVVCACVAVFVCVVVFACVPCHAILFTRFIMLHIFLFIRDV